MRRSRGQEAMERLLKGLGNITTVMVAASGLKAVAGLATDLIKYRAPAPDAAIGYGTGQAIA